MNIPTDLLLSGEMGMLAIALLVAVGYINKLIKRVEGRVDEFVKTETGVLVASIHEALKDKTVTVTEVKDIAEKGKGYFAGKS